MARIQKNNMRIKQCEYSEARIGPFSYFLEKYNLKKYALPNKPAIFFGMYSKLGLNILKRHKSLAVIIWRGSDIISDKKRLESVMDIMKKNKDIKHVAISSFIEKDLNKFGIQYKSIPITGSNLKGFESCPLGNEIYAYAPSTRYNFYGGSYLDKIKDKCKFKINIGRSSGCYTRAELYDIYKRSFMGLRLTEHDGIANQVIEMGLMGRRCIHNGGQSNCVFWKNSDDILKSIEEESSHIGEVREEVSVSVKKYIDVGTNWLDTDYWS